jgi:hypothetical protein
MDNMRKQTKMDKRTLEKYSSAFTMSDMEIFIFPDLLFALVLGNILSPEIWKWKKDKWFAGIGKMTPLKKIHRVKQYIMDHYNFNLDLETWGLTDKQTEINRFRDFIDPDILSRSNALFGYEGDKYYFDIDIRRHFGLDQYDTDIIPYWKTETVEAMNAFRYKPGLETGAGECVSLACLYAAALFIVAGIPLEKIFLMGTPLHSQNFILVDKGVLTNNRRILTRAMWYNGTELSALARRALEHEQVTVVAHSSGWIHAIYPEATIDEHEYRKFREILTIYLTAGVSFELFINFLRSFSRYQKLFQLAWNCRGSIKYIHLEKAFSYEHDSKNRLGDNTGKALFCEIDEEEMAMHPLDYRVIIDPESDLFTIHDFPGFRKATLDRYPILANRTDFFDDLKRFLHTVPKLPPGDKFFLPSSGHQVTLSPADSREEIASRLSAIRHDSSVVDLAFYAGRFMDSCDWRPFLKAAFERNPVSIDYFREKDIEQIYQELLSWPDQSIYEGNRLALPDEVVNFRRGDGIEKAITLVNCIKSGKETGSFHMTRSGDQIKVKLASRTFLFSTLKSLGIPAI